MIWDRDLEIMGDSPIYKENLQSEFYFRINIDDGSQVLESDKLGNRFFEYDDAEKVFTDLISAENEIEKITIEKYDLYSDESYTQVVMSYKKSLSGLKNKEISTIKKLEYLKLHKDVLENPYIQEKINNIINDLKL